MSEITKLYDNAGIEPEINYICDKEPCEQYWVDCQECSHLYDTRVYYPEFTAEKQIELIKFISGWNMFLKNNAGQFNIATGDNAISYYAENLENAICLCINSKWQFMNAEEKQQIKEILQ